MVFDQIRDLEVPITLRPHYVYIDVPLPATSLCMECVLLKKGKNSLLHERYAFKYTPSDKTNGL